MGKETSVPKIVKDCFRKCTEALHIITARENTEVWTEMDEFKILPKKDYEKMAVN